MKPSIPRYPRLGIRPGFVFAAMLVLAAWPVRAADLPQQEFASPEAGVSALAEAVAGDDVAQLVMILGPVGKDLIDSGDETLDLQGREAFTKAYREAHRIVSDGASRATLEIGRDEWPFPIPLVKTAEGWNFDTAEGAEEILTRRIGHDELAAMQACRTIVSAERQFLARGAEGGSPAQYAARFLSTAGRRDGLYWEDAANAPSGSLELSLARAGIDGAPSGMAGGAPQAPYRGYFFRILTGQGAAATGGERSYWVDGRLSGGFAVLAFPARYRASGVMSFLVGPDGSLFEKDFGGDTEAATGHIATFNPDAGWTKVPKPSAP